MGVNLMKPAPPPADTLAYNQREAARVLGVSDRTLRRWEKAGAVVPAVVRGVKLYPRQTLERLLAVGTTATPEGTE